MANEFILDSSLESLKYNQGLYKLNTCHAKWVESFQTFHFTIKHNSWKLNKGVDVLPRSYLLLFQLDACVLGFKHLKNLYDDDKDFGRGEQTNRLPGPGSKNLEPVQPVPGQVPKILEAEPVPVPGTRFKINFFIKNKYIQVNNK